MNYPGKGIASDIEIEASAQDIFNILRIFDSPKDAACALALGYFYFIRAAFPPEELKKAMEAIDQTSKFVKECINDGLN